MNDDIPDLPDRVRAGEAHAPRRGRLRYTGPALSDLGDLRRLIAAGNAASSADLGGTWPNMQKLTMLG